MSTITKERVAQIIHAVGLEPCDYEEVFDSIKTGEIVAMARIALASLEAENKPKQPDLSQVIYHFRDWNEGFPVERFKADYVISWMLANYPPAPPAPVSMPLAIHDEDFEKALAVLNDTLDDCGDSERGLLLALDKAGIEVRSDACRAAMLQGAEPVSNRDELPIWVACSVRMPEESGRYWCYVEEQNDLGKSHYQWNCSWNGDRWWIESENGGRVTHWMLLPPPPLK